MWGERGGRSACFLPSEDEKRGFGSLPLGIIFFWLSEIRPCILYNLVFCLRGGKEDACIIFSVENSALKSWIKSIIVPSTYSFEGSLHYLESTV